MLQSRIFMFSRLIVNILLRLLSFGEIKEPSEYLDYLRRKENERLVSVFIIV